jgi:hypothetical protein
MSDEKETKLSEDELKQVAGGKPAVMVTVKKPQITTWPTIDGLKGESAEKGHQDE